MKYLLIQNQGCIDPFDLSYMGGSTKREDTSMIGFFGSGNKYALATLITHSIPFRIFSGMNEIHVKTEPITRKNTTFDAIYFEFNGKRIDTSLTAQMGPQWEPWFAVREIYCNAIDEGGVQVVPATTNIEPSENNTRFYIGVTKEIEPVISQWNKYFSKDRYDIHEELEGLKVFYKYDKGLRIYRRGILVHEDAELESLFDYDIHDAEINENRTLGNVYGAKWKIERILSSKASSDILKRVLLGLHISELEKKKIFEQDMDFHDYMSKNKEQWQKAAEGFTLINRSVAGIYTEEQRDDNALVLPANIIRGLVNNVTEEITTFGVERKGLRFPYKPYQATEDELISVMNAVRFMQKAGYMETEYEIEIVKFDNPHVMGSILADKILISKAAIEQGIRMIAATLLEELFHIESKMKDETRAFQNFILNKTLVEIEKRSGQFL